MRQEEKSLALEQFASTRGFTEHELARWGIHVAGDVVTIPILGRQGSWGNRIHRPNGRPKYQNEVEGMGHHLYNPLGLGPNASEVWLTEGEFDTLSLVTVGAAAVGILGASGFRREWALLYSGARVIVAFDPDSESDEQAKRVAKLMGLFEGHVTRFDPLLVGGYDDINDWFKKDRASLKAEVARWHSNY